MASDLSALHRIDDMYRMGSRRWAQLVPRLVAYQGAVQHRLRVEAARMQEEEQGAPVAAPVQPATQPAGAGGVGLASDGVTPLLPGPPSPWADRAEMVNSDRASLAFSPIGDMFSFG